MVNRCLLQHLLVGLPVEELLSGVESGHAHVLVWLLLLSGMSHG